MGVEEGSTSRQTRLDVLSSSPSSPPPTPHRNPLMQMIQPGRLASNAEEEEELESTRDCGLEGSKRPKEMKDVEPSPKSIMDLLIYSLTGRDWPA